MLAPIHTHPKRWHGGRAWTCFILAPLAILLAIWIYAALHFLTLEIDELGGGADATRGGAREADNPTSKLLSRNPKVSISSSARGNLGPPSVMNQDPPGSDWIKDRWQAASDMGGTAIPGSHWVLMDFSGMLNENGGSVYVSKMVLDWETAFAKNYRIEGRLTPPPLPKNGHNNLRKGADEDDGEWCVLYDGALDNDASEKASIYPHRSVVEFGQSPGVKQKLPLHIIHSINWSSDKHELGESASRDCHILRYLRIFIRKPARGWGVSLWQVDVYGATVDGSRQ